ncbi:MAG TPA: outer membrane beta-barrel protein [Kofleriaceae bacterium]
MASILFGSRARAQAPAEPTDPPPATTETADIATRLRELEQKNEELEAKQAEMADEIELLKEDNKYLEEQTMKLGPIATKLTGYMDLGFFSVQGNGSGIRPDTGFMNFPEYETSGVPDSWVFMGDPLSTMVNARGEPGTTGESRAITFDSIGTRKSTFLINTLSVGLFADVAKRALFTGKIDLLPRGRDVSQPDGLFVGDFVDVKLAYLEYRIPGKRLQTSVYAGKFDSVIGMEYRSQEAPTRIEVTPSLICRYTCGYPIGVKARVIALDAISLNAAVTNGSHFSEGFPFSNEIDSNHFKTLAGRLAFKLPNQDLEVGASGMFGAQDNQSKDSVYQWMYGLDAHYHRHDLVVRAEFVQGRARGETEMGSPRCGLAPCLTFKGAYGLVGYRATNLLMPFARVDWRDALHESGASFIYISKLLRATAGLRLQLNENVIIKAEYIVNRELGRIPQFPNDLFTSALVVKY